MRYPLRDGLCYTDTSESNNYSDTALLLRCTDCQPASHASMESKPMTTGQLSWADWYVRMRYSLSDCSRHADTSESSIDSHTMDTRLPLRCIARLLGKWPGARSAEESEVVAWWQQSKANDPRRQRKPFICSCQKLPDGHRRKPRLWEGWAPASWPFFAWTKNQMQLNLHLNFLPGYHKFPYPGYPFYPASWHDEDLRHVLTETYPEVVEVWVYGKGSERWTLNRQCQFQNLNKFNHGDLALDCRALVLQVSTYVPITARMNQRIRYGFANVHDRNREVD